MPTRLLLARHGETDWNRNHRWQGFTGPPLNELGREQAEALAASLDPVDVIYSSDSERARETALPAARRFNLDVIEDIRLRESNFGEWEGLTRPEINARYPDAFTQWDACDVVEPPPGGETDVAMAARVIEAVTEIGSRHPGKTVLVVTSGGPIRVVEAHALSLEQSTARRRLPGVDNCAVIEAVVDDGEIAVVRGSRT